MVLMKARILISKTLEILANMIFLEIKKDIVCEIAQSVRKLKILKNFGKHVVIAKIAKKNIGEIELQKTKNHMQKIEKHCGSKGMLEIAKRAKENLLEEKEIIAAQNVSLKIILKRKTMVVGNGTVLKINQDMDILQTLKLTKDKWLIDTRMRLILDPFKKVFTFVTHVIIQNAVLLPIYFWEQIKIICRIVKIKEEQPKAIRLLEKVNRMGTQYSPMKLFWRLESYVLKVLKIEKLQRSLEPQYFKLMLLDTGEHGNISKGVILGRV
jgi:hypothetical protein